MANLALELNINSASDLENVHYITKMNVYAVITLGGDKRQKKQKVKTGVDHSGGSNPIWNHAETFFINEKLALEGRLTLVVNLFSKRLLGDKDVGAVEVPLLDLLRSHTLPTNGNSNGMRFVMKGYLSFSYRFSGVPFLPGYGYHQAPMWAIPSQHGYGPYGYMPLPPPPPLPPGYGYGGPPPKKPSRIEAWLEEIDDIVSDM